MSENHGIGQLTEEDLAKMSPEQIRDLQRKNCIFCHIISGKVQSKKVYEDDRSLGILDINPANPGHILLLPKEHYTIMPQMPDDEVGYLFMVAKGLSHACLKTLKAEGTNIFVANGIAAGQKSPHFMIHIVPRKSNDGVSSFGIARKKIERSQLLEIQAEIAKRLGGEAIHDSQDHSASASPSHETLRQGPEDYSEEKKSPRSNLQAHEADHSGKEQETKEETSKDDTDVNLDDIAKILGGK